MHYTISFKLDLNQDSIYSFFTKERIFLSPLQIGLPENHQFSEKRFADFSTGRFCAMKVLEQYGISDAIVPIGKDREPIWPAGFVGSISHCDKLSGAIIAMKSDYISLGLDIEEIGIVTPELWDLVLTENEKNYLYGLSEEDKRIQSTAIFSIKEAFYKFQYPLTKTFLDFLDVEVALPSFSHVSVLSELISQDSPIRINKSTYTVEKSCIVSIVTQE